MDKNALQFGWAEIDITPDKKASLAGQFAERISQYVEKPITATALAITSNEDQAVLVSVDLVSVGYNLVERVREALKDNDLGLDPDKVILSAIHTHTAPSHIRTQKAAKMIGKSRSSRQLLEELLPAGKKYIESAPVTNNPDVVSPQEYLDFLAEKLPQVILQAWKNRTAGAYSNAFGRAAVGMCRRAAYSDGSAQMWGDTNTAVFESLEGGNDSGIELMYLFDENQKLTGVIANLACPAQCVQHRLFISPDFWGEVKKNIREHFGSDIYLLSLCSAAGDQCPVDLVRWVEPESDLNDPNCHRDNPPKRKADPSMFDLAGMRKAGRRVSQEIINTYEDGLDPAISSAPFAHMVDQMPLPLRRVTLADVEAAKKAIADYLRNKEGDVDYNDAANLQRYTGILNRFQAQEIMDTLETEVHIIRLGNIAFATNPFELFLDYGNQIKARSLAEQTFLVQLANGHEGYLPTKKAEEGGHYSAFVASGNIGHQGGELLVRKTLMDIRKLFS